MIQSMKRGRSKSTKKKITEKKTKIIELAKIA